MKRLLTRLLRRPCHAQSPVLGALCTLPAYHEGEHVERLTNGLVYDVWAA